MAQFVPQTSKFQSLQGKVVVISGAATGIGAATTTLLAQAGAHIIIGDINESAAKQLISFLSSSDSKSEITFVPCNVTIYSDIYALFHTAYDKYGRVDHAVSCAGIFEQGAWFDPALTVESVQDPTSATTAVIDVNVMGTANFARIAVVFLRDGKQVEQDKSLTLLSSVNAFRESPGLYMYQTSKHAIQGLMRSMRKTIYERDGIRVNCVCPGVTESPMTVGIVDIFKQNGLYWQKSEDVAKFIVGIQAEETMNGKAIYIEGGDGWEFEDSFYATQPQWLGEEPTRRMRINTEAVNKGALIKK